MLDYLTFTAGDGDSRLQLHIDPCGCVTVELLGRSGVLLGRLQLREESVEGVGKMFEIAVRRERAARLREEAAEE